MERQDGRGKKRFISDGEALAEGGEESLFVSRFPVAGYH
jgi:hypothetical protein